MATSKKAVTAAVQVFPTSERLAGRVAVVTAAGQGIGRASALAMAAAGCKVIATDMNAKLLASLKGLENIEIKTLNVLDDKAVDRLFKALPRVDILFNCAGWVHQGSMLECQDDDWDLSMNLNVRAQWRTIRAVLPKMLQAGGGSIINMASVCGSLKGLPNRFAYGVSKAAVVGLTKSVAADFVAKGIRCNCIAPGTVDTPSLGERINTFADPVEARKMFIARQPMGRLAKAEEIAPIVVYLASDEAQFMSGQIVSVDGGMTI
jgi:2-keto-3-deoxy-L-fuconate dehydrogenase